MTIELLTVLSIQFGGMALALTTGIRQLLFLIPVGFIAGLCIHINLGALQSIFLLQTWPLVTIVLTALLPAGWWYLRYRRGAAEAPPLLRTSAVLVLIVAAAFALHSMDRVNFHVDSHEYLAIGSMLSTDTFRDGVSLFQLEKRMLVVPLQNAPANLSDSYFLISINPLLGAATLLLLAWLCTTGLRGHPGGSWVPVLVAMAAALALLTINRFVHNLFYLNSHLFVAALVLLLAGTTWLVASRSTAVRHVRFFPVQLIAIPVLVLARPEGALLAAIVVAPTVLSPHQPLAHRTGLVTMLGASTVTWQLFLLRLVYDRGGEVTEAMVGMLAFGAAVLASAPLLRWRVIQGRPVLAMSFIEASLWVVLLMAVVRYPSRYEASLNATVENTLGGGGGWGASLALLAVLVVIALVATRASGRMPLRYPLTMFVPLSALLVHLGGGPFQVGAADSLNRMLIHIVPLAILFVASAAQARPAWQPSTRTEQGSHARRPALDSAAEVPLRP